MAATGPWRQIPYVRRGRWSVPWTIRLGERRAGATPGPATCIRVLVVEDNRVIRDVLLDADVANGDSAFIMKAICSLTSAGGVAPPAGTVRLTKREQEIKELIAAGLGNKEIAQRLNIATNTVKSHIHNMLGKLAALTPPLRPSPADGRRDNHGRRATSRRSYRFRR